MRNEAWIAGGIVVAALLLRPLRAAAAPRTNTSTPAAAAVVAVSEERLRRGCPEAPFPTPPYVQENARLVQRYLQFVQGILGPMEERGWWRPPACNDRRGGTGRSRHLEGGAIDLDLTRDQRTALRSALVQSGTISSTSWTGTRSGNNAWGDQVRSAIGVNTGIGLIIYPSGALHLDVGCLRGGAGLCDPRSSDYISIA